MEGTAKIKSHSLKSVLFQWETMILVIFIIINIININLFSNYLNFSSMMDNTAVFMDRALMVFTIMVALLLGEIDISIASIVCLSGYCTGVTFEAGLSIVPAMMAGLLVGAAHDFFNEILLAAFPDLNSTIVTLGNRILSRGIVYMILEDKPITSAFSEMSSLAWSKAAGILLILIAFLVETLVFAFIIHRTKFRRSLCTIGSNAKASGFPGIKTNRIKVLVFTLSGLYAGFAGPFLISKLESARASIAKGYEMGVIAMAILDRVSTTGGKGKVLSTVLGVFSIGPLHYDLGIVNVSSQILMIIIGALLIVAVTIPSLKKMISESTSDGWIRPRVIHNKQK